MKSTDIQYKATSETMTKFQEKHPLISLVISLAVRIGVTINKGTKFKAR